MVTVTLHKEGDRWIVELPNYEIERLGLDEGQRVELDVRLPLSDSDRRQLIDRIMDHVVVEYREAFEYLAR
jgi:antitoxin component of MazEF toxin-antitoxin module